MVVRQSLQHCACLNNTQVYIFLIVQWLIACTVSFILLTDIVEVSPSPSRYICAMTPDASLPLACVTMTMLFLPVIVTTICFVLLYKSISKEKHKARQADDHYRESGEFKDLIIAPTSKEVGCAKYVFALFMCWVIMQCPHHILTFVEQLLYLTGQETILQDQHRLKVSFTWLRLGHVVVLPFVTFCWRKDVWQKFKHVILCHKVI